MEFRQQALRDVFDAASWYEQRRPELGVHFVEDLDRVVARIEEVPAQFPLYEPPARRALLSRFPYAVYYLTTPLIVLRVPHLRRHPDTWKATGGG